MQKLRKAVAAGFRDEASLRTDPDLDSLRHEPDFPMIVMDAAFPEQPFRGGPLLPPAR